MATGVDHHQTSTNSCWSSQLAWHKHMVIQRSSYEDNQLCPTCAETQERERRNYFNITTWHCTHAVPLLSPPSEVQSANSITHIPVQRCMTNCQPSSHALSVSVWLAEDKWICNSLLSLPPSHLITLTANCCRLHHTHTHTLNGPISLPFYINCPSEPIRKKTNQRARERKIQKQRQEKR